MSCIFYFKGGINVDVIAKHSYFQVTREVKRLEKSVIKYQHELKLYQNKLTTRHREFSIEELLDVSPRQKGKEGGLILIHTTSGLFSYTVEEINENFIHSVNNLIWEMK